MGEDGGEVKVAVGARWVGGGGCGVPVVMGEGVRVAGVDDGVRVGRRVGRRVGVGVADAVGGGVGVSAGVAVGVGVGVRVEVGMGVAVAVGLAMTVRSGSGSGLVDEPSLASAVAMSKITSGSSGFNLWRPNGSTL